MTVPSPLPRGFRYSAKTPLVAVLIVVVAVGVFSFCAASHPGATSLRWSNFQRELTGHQVQRATVDRSDGAVTGSLRDGAAFQTTGPVVLSVRQMELLAEDAVTTYTRSASSAPWSLILVLMTLCLAGLVVWARHRDKVVPNS